MDHQCSPLSHPEIRRPDGGWPIPDVGQTVNFRAICGGPTSPAEVLSVASLEDKSDFNVWRIDDAGNIVIRRDPNPSVELRASSGGVTTTRRVRFAGSPGWSWSEE